MLQQKIRISLKRSENLSYNVVEVEKLMKVLKSTQEVERSMQAMVPTEDGLMLRPHGMTTITARKIILKYKQQKHHKQSQKYSSLAIARKRGRPKTQRLWEKSKLSVSHCVTLMIELQQML